MGPMISSDLPYVLGVRDPGGHRHCDPTSQPSKLLPSSLPNGRPLANLCNKNSLQRLLHSPNRSVDGHTGDLLSCLTVVLASATTELTSVVRVTFGMAMQVSRTKTSVEPNK